MDKKILNRLFVIVSLLLLIAGVVFLCISIWNGNETSTPIACALGCILLSNLFNIIRQLNNKNKKQNENELKGFGEDKQHKYKYKKVDAFTSGSSKGNPAAFMLLGNEILSETKCVEIAKEHSGFISEFVFVNASEKAELKLSYYSSECEVDFCGHGNIATMYELIKNDKDLVRKTEISFETNKKGILTAYNHIQDENAVYVSAPKAVFL